MYCCFFVIGVLSFVSKLFIDRICVVALAHAAYIVGSYVVRHSILLM